MSRLQAWKYRVHQYFNECSVFQYAVETLSKYIQGVCLVSEKKFIQWSHHQVLKKTFSVMVQQLTTCKQVEIVRQKVNFYSHSLFLMCLWLSSFITVKQTQCQLYQHSIKSESKLFRDGFGSLWVHQWDTASDTPNQNHTKYVCLFSFPFSFYLSF